MGSDGSALGGERLVIIAKGGIGRAGQRLGAKFGYGYRARPRESVAPTCNAMALAQAALDLQGG